MSEETDRRRSGSSTRHRPGRQRRRSYKVFVSYRWRDTQPEAGVIKDLLTRRYGEGTVFLDDTATTGTFFDQEIRRSIAEAHVLVALVGQDWYRPRDRR